MTDFLFLETPIEKVHDFYLQVSMSARIGNSNSRSLRTSVIVTLSSCCIFSISLFSQDRRFYWNWQDYSDEEGLEKYFCMS